MISARQIRAARGLLGWDAKDLAQKADLTRETISRIESGQVRPQERTMAKIQRIFDENGVEFTANSGVQLKPQNVEVLEGASGFAKFYDYLYEHLRVFGGEACVGGVNERIFTKYQAGFAESHKERMTALVKERDDIRMRILVQEGDYNFAASAYASYRWQPKERFSPASFFVFGDYLGLISFVHEPAPLIVFVHSPGFANTYRKSFNLNWSMAMVPPEEGKEDHDNYSGA